jgi:hypothetical protein
MKNSRQTDIEPALESLFKQLRLREPSSELDQKISAMSRSVQRQSTPMQRENLRLGWPAIISVALVACLFGIVLGNRINTGANGISANSLDSITDSSAGSTTDRGKRTLASTEIENGIEAFNWIHGHSVESANQDCADCHLFHESANEGHFYDREILAQHPNYFPKCSRCHNAAFKNGFESNSNS